MASVWSTVYPNRCPVCGREHIVRGESCKQNDWRRVIREELERIQSPRPAPVKGQLEETQHG